MATPIFPAFELNVDDPYSTVLNYLEQSAIMKMLPVESQIHPVNFHFPSHIEEQDNEDEQVNGFVEEYTRNGTADAYFRETKITAISQEQTETKLCPDFSDEIKFEPEALLLNDLQLLHVEPWSDLICEDINPINIIYNKLLPIPVPPMPFQDPLKQEQSILKPATRQLELSLKKGLLASNIEMDYKEIQYPTPPAYDYLLEILEKKIQKFKPNHYDDEDLDKPSLSNEGTAIDIESSSVHSCEIMHPTVPVDLIELDLQGLAADMLFLLEQKLFSCWNDLMCMDLTPPMDQLKDYQSTFHQLDPQISRKFLTLLKEALTRKQKERTTSNLETNLKNILPVLLLFHGLNKTIDVYLNIDFELAYQTFLDFKKTHHRELKDDCKPLLIHLFHQIQNEQEQLHPKLSQLRVRITRHLEEKVDGKVWIRLQRYSKQIGRKIRQILACAGVECALDPRMLDSDSLVYPSEYHRVFVSDRALEGFPFSLISLVIDYEWPVIFFKNDHQWLTVERKALKVRRTPHAKEIPLVDSVASEKVVDDTFEFPENCDANGNVDEHLIDDAVEDFFEEVEDPATLPLDCAARVTRVGDLTGEDVASSQSFSNERESLSEGIDLVASSALKMIGDIAKQLESIGAFNIHELDYSFLDGNAIYQPDILVSLNTAVFIIAAEEFADMKEIRLKILSASFKCTNCWIIGLVADVTRLTAAPFFWTPLIGLMRFYASRPDSTFQLRFRLAVNSEQIASIVADIANEENLSEHHFDSANEDVQFLLYFSCFNAMSAAAVLQQLKLVDLVTWPLEDLSATVHSRLLLEKIKAFRDSMNEPFSSSQPTECAGESMMELACSYGKLKVFWPDPGQEGSRYADPLPSQGSPKKLKLIDGKRDMSSMLSSWDSTSALQEIGQ